MKTLKGIFITAAMFCLMGAAGAQGQAKGPRVVLEEEEITLFDDNGKELEKRYVSSSGEEKQAILNQVKEKVLRKLRVQSEREVNEKGLGNKRKEESRKLLKVTELKQPRLEFFDKKGKIYKEFALGHEIEVTTTTQTGQRENFKKVTNRRAKISKNGRYVLMTRTYADSSTFPGETAKLEYYNADGNLIWEKQFPKLRTGDGKISEDGSRICLTEMWTEDFSKLSQDEPYEQFVVYGKTGDVILKFPKTKQEGYRVSGDIEISPNGRYVAVKTINKENKQVLLFVNTNDKTYWIYSEKAAYVSKISDYGVARLGFYGPLPGEDLDLKSGHFIPVP